MNIFSSFEIAEGNIQDTLTIALGYTLRQKAMVVFDEDSKLAQLLVQLYRKLIPEAWVLRFDSSNSEDILHAIDSLSAGDLVVLIQSTSFRLSKFRIRIELFNRGLKVIEHPHLGRIREDEYSTYFESLAYDPSYYRSLGPKLKERIACAAQVKIMTEGAELIYDSAFEDPRLNIGYYEGMKNIGGQFPIGEIFTEPKEVTRVNGTVRLFAFGDADFSVHVPAEPFIVRVDSGLLYADSRAPRAFRKVLEDIESKEEVVWIRELGFGLNRALTREKRVTDIGTYERMCGVHLSLGAKHLQYKKPEFPKKQGFHVDVFIDTQRVEIDGATVFKNGAYTL